MEDHAVFRNVLAFVLSTRPGVEVVAGCGSVAECRALGRDLLASVDVGLLDLGLPDGEGTELVADLRGANPAVAVIVLSAGIEAGMRERVLGAGADGVLDKVKAPTGIADEVARLAGGLGG